MDPAVLTNPVLITGATGLLGRAMVARLAGKRLVYALVRRFSGGPSLHGAIEIQHDLRTDGELLLPGVPDTVIHLAQSPHYREFPKEAGDVFAVNVASTQRLLDYAARNGVKRFIYASSGGVYGYGAKPFDEESPLSIPANHYLSTKRCGELLAQAYRGKMHIIVLRFFFIYGPNQRASMLIPRLVNSVRQGLPIILQDRDGIRLNPVDVEDASAAVEAAMELNTSEIINVAGPEVLSLRQIGTLVGESLGKTPLFDVQRGGEVCHLVGDTRKMSRLLGGPQIRFSEGARRVARADVPADR